MKVIRWWKFAAVMGCKVQQSTAGGTYKVCRHAEWRHAPTGIKAEKQEQQQPHWQQQQLLQQRSGKQKQKQVTVNEQQ